MYPILTKDPVSGHELIVTRLECPESGVLIEGRFSLGWMGALTPDQLDFVGLLLRHRNNLQRLAAELGVAYNTARSRLDEIVAAVGGTPGARPDTPEPDAQQRAETLEKLAAGELTYEQAMAALRGASGPDSGDEGTS